MRRKWSEKAIYGIGLMALTACTSDSELREEAQVPIGLSAYTAQPAPQPREGGDDATRADATLLAEKGIPDGQSIGVYAYYHASSTWEDDYSAGAGTVTPNFMNNQQATYDADDDDALLRARASLGDPAAARSLTPGDLRGVVLGRVALNTVSSKLIGLVRIGGRSSSETTSSLKGGLGLCLDCFATAVAVAVVVSRSMMMSAVEELRRQVQSEESPRMIEGSSRSRSEGKRDSDEDEVSVEEDEAKRERGLKTGFLRRDEYVLRRFADRLGGSGFGGSFGWGFGCVLVVIVGVRSAFVFLVVLFFVLVLVLVLVLVMSLSL